MPNKTIMIIEDDIETQLLFSELLTSENYQVISAEHGREALTKLQSDVFPDLILMDLNFPEGSPEEFLKNLRADKKGKTTPVIIVSGDSNSAGQVKLLGAQGKVDKPFDIDTLLNTIDHQIGAVS